MFTMLTHVLFQDVITDLVIDRGDLTIPGIQCASAHNGILQSAVYIQKTLEENQILEKAFQSLEVSCK